MILGHILMILGHILMITLHFTSFMAITSSACAETQFQWLPAALLSFLLILKPPSFLNVPEQSQFHT